MTVEELGRKCKEIRCDKCRYKKKCEKLGKMLEGISPKELLTILQYEIEIDE